MAKAPTNIDLREVDIKGGFLHEKQRMIREVTARTVYDRFEDTGRFKAFECAWREGMPDKPHIFWDSDVAKWMEGAAYLIQKERDPWLEEVVDRVTDLIEKNRSNDGYFNIYFLNIEPSKRFSNRGDHELYCAGHLFEAAVAYYHATGKDKLLRLMCDYADYIEKVFAKEGSAGFATPGHEEIELALVKLYHCTGEKRYLNLSKHFVDTRGTKESDNIKDLKPSYIQSHLPVREQTTAEGHAVRAAYLYCAMADLAREYGDAELFAACRRLFLNIVNKRMYITGGTGSTHVGEAFTLDYDLPNLTAYAETCAAIGLCMFSDRMSLIDHDSLYADTAETAMYNGVMSGVSLDGKSFFYTNPLEINVGLASRHTSTQSKDWLPETSRREVFGCSCCPPNILRFIASMGQRLYCIDGDTVYIDHYAESAAETELFGKRLSIEQKTDYPFCGRVAISVDYPGEFTLALRIPGWCDEHSVSINGEAARPPLERGYAFIKVVGHAEIVLSLNMGVCFLKADPRVRACAGRYAVRRGPVVYCAEGVDNGPYLWDLELDGAAEPAVTADASLCAPVTTLRARRRGETDGDLYSREGGAYISCEARLIPYFAFANRGESDMLVWFRAYNI